MAARGLTVTSGHIHDKPKDVDFYVEVIDRWQRDVGMFLASLDIHFRDNATGDLIATGTPAGVSRLQHGDVVEVEVEGIGVLQNKVREFGAEG